MRALKYFFTEAVASLWRRRGAALLSIVTIAAGLFVLGVLVIVNANVQRLVSRWTDTAELAVYLRDDVTEEQRAAIRQMLDRSGLTENVRVVSKEDARRAFERDFPDLAPAASTLERNPFPASIEARLNARARDAAPAVDAMASAVGSLAGVSDVRYDRKWLARLNSTVRVIRGAGLLIIVLLAIASAFTVANVVHLAVTARAAEIEIMQLVGAPFAYIRGPFIIEGLLQGGLGALGAIALLAAAFAVFSRRAGAAMAQGFGVSGVAFAPVNLLLLLVIGGMALGCVGGAVVARRVR